MTAQKQKTQNMGLPQKLIEIRKTCSYLKKDNQGYQFKYVSSSQTLGTLRSKMDELGVLLVPRVQTHTVSKHTNSKGNEEFFTELEIEFSWLDAETGETLTCPFYAQGIDSGEKGVGKALTYAEKYFMLKFFNIATDKDDPDAFQNKYGDNGKEHREANPKTQQAAQPRANGPKPVTDAQVKKINTLAGKLGLARMDKIERINAWLQRAIGPQRKIQSTSELTLAEATKLIEQLEAQIPKTAPRPEPQNTKMDNLPF